MVCLGSPCAELLFTAALEITWLLQPVEPVRQYYLLILLTVMTIRQLNTVFSVIVVINGNIKLFSMYGAKCTYYFGAFS